MLVENRVLKQIDDTDIIDGHIILSDDIEYIADSVFHLNSNLTSIVFPKNLKGIGRDAFNGCDSLIEVNLPSSVEKIASSAFANCYYLKRVNLKEGLTSIGVSAFSNCYSLEEITLPSSLQYLGGRAFFSCSSLEKIIIPKKIENLWDSTFKECRSLNEVVLPSNLKKIGDFCFNQCGDLKKIILNDSLQELGIEAFSECYKLESINIPSDIEVLNEGTFKFCQSLKSIVFYEGLKRIDNEVFFGCEKLKQIVLPNSVTYIGESAFEQCWDLKSAILPINLKRIAPKTFAECRDLEKVTLPNNLEGIDFLAFSYCISLRNLDLPESLKRIGNSAFFQCISLDYIEIPKLVRTIEYDTFSLCKSLQNVTLHDGLKKIGEGAFYGCESLKDITIPSSVTLIDQTAFQSCKQLKDVKFSEGLEEIGECAFADTCVCKIELPKSIKLVDRGAFSNTNLSQLTIYSDTSLNYQNLVNVDMTIINTNTDSRVNLNVNLVTSCSEDLLIFKQDGSGCYFFDLENNWIELDYYKCMEYTNYRVNPLYYNRIYEWEKRNKFIPHHKVVENMPLKEIDNFYINDNSKKWRDLNKMACIEGDEDKEGFFKLCYVLGLFNKKGSVSERAFDFIKNNIINKLSLGEYYQRFSNLDIYKKGYNEEFAQLVFKYFVQDELNGGFLVRTSDSLVEENSDYFCCVYNEFDKIRKTYPNKKVKTNRKADELTPSMCIDAISYCDYYDINDGNEEFAKNMGMYGYSQEDFERAQILFDEGKSISQDEITLFATCDDENEKLSYELLSKDDPLGIILGDITNCCQTIIGIGRECVEYGLSKRNSKFLTFRFNNNIIGQSWVWYDEKTKIICLDNIEMPKSIVDNQLKDKNFKELFIRCLKRCVKGFLSAMESHNLSVNSIRIGEGHNDMCELLTSYQRLQNQSILTGYAGYSDAENQYVLYSR